MIYAHAPQCYYTSILRVLLRMKRTAVTTERRLAWGLEIERKDEEEQVEEVRKQNRLGTGRTELEGKQD